MAVLVAFLTGLPMDQLVSAISKGAGNTLAGVGLIVVLGAALGQLMTDCGASKRVADVILKTCGTKFLKWGLLFIGSIFGTAMFFEVGFVIMMPLVIGIAREAKVPYMICTWSSHRLRPWLKLTPCCHRSQVQWP